MLNNTTTTVITTTNNNHTMTMSSSPSNTATIPNSSTTPLLVKSLMVYANNNNNNNDTNFNNNSSNSSNISSRSISLTNDISNTYTTCNTSSSNHCNNNIKGDIASYSNILGTANTNTNNISITATTNTAVNNIKFNKDPCNNNRNRQLPLVIENLSNNNCNIATGSCCSAIDNKPTTTNIINYNNINNTNNKNITFSALTNSLAATVGNNIIQRLQQQLQHQQQLQVLQQQQQQQSSSLQLPFVTSPLKTIGAQASSLLNSSLSSSTASSSSFKAYPSINSAYWQPSPHPSPYAIPERKLFVGMLNKKLNENDVRKLFEVHGAIEECTVLRDQNGQSKGCAFVTFATKHAAISAIKVTLNQNKTMEGCTSPLVVKFADTQKEKEQKKIQQYQANLWNLATNINIPLGQTATTVSTPMLPNPPQQASPVLGADAITPASLQLLQQLQAVGLQQQLWQGLGAQTNTADTAAAAAAGLLPPMTVQNLAALAAMTQSSLTNAATNPGSAQLTNTAALLWSDPNSLASAYMSTAGLSQFGSTALTSSPLASVALSNAAAAAAGKQIEGPEGCNLFIYHLPQEFTDTDLASTFLPFGNVISAKVFIDKHTNLSKCFGFVSFDNAESAQVAIKAMNGFQVGTKRLKVQLKKPKDASKPY